MRVSEAEYGVGEKKSRDDWARFWFAKLATYHRVHDAAKWAFTAEDVIAFPLDHDPRFAAVILATFRLRS